MLDAETVTWIPTSNTTDDYGNATPTEGQQRTLVGMFATRTNLENEGADSPAVALTKSLYLLDASVTPSSSDRLIIRGESYEVVGDAHRWGSMGVEVIVKRTEARP